MYDGYETVQNLRKPAYDAWMEGMYDLSTVRPTVRKFGQHKSSSTEAASAFKSPVVKTIYVDRLKNLARSLRNLFISQIGIAS